jgi:hypothetical protein
MMRCIALFLCLAILTGGCVAREASVRTDVSVPAPAPERQPQPRPASQSSDPAVWDFGKIAHDTVVKHEFTVTNASKRTLAIKGVATSCGCTASEAAKKELAPGESTPLTVSFNSKGYSNEVSQFVYVNTDDPENPVIKFTIKAFVQ